MKFHIVHRTTYSYTGSVTVSHHLARLAPRSLPGQRCPWHELEIKPVPVGPEFAAYASPEFPPGRPVLEGLLALTHRVFHDFTFDPRATEVSTPVAEVLRNRAGVCQDFAHLMLACLRSLGLPARYVSGYLETAPPPGATRLLGADASHAWISLFCGEAAGWVDADPTNNILPGERHITVAWGRDFSDVSPLRGVTLGAGGQSLAVAVDVIPVEEG